jgi:ribosomal protein L24
MTARKSGKPRPEVGNWVEVTRGSDKGTRGRVVRIDKAGNGRPLFQVRPAGRKTVRPYPLGSLTVRAVQLAFDITAEEEA